MTLRNDSTDRDLVQELLELELRMIDGAKAIPRPHGIEKFYLEEAVEKKAAEQPLLWEARGEADARSWTAKAAALRHAAGVGGFPGSPPQKPFA
jgi:hypothetical protein